MKKFFSLICTISALLLRGQVAGAQSSEPFNPFSAFKASAEVWAMSKYGDAKPSLYTGAMHYSVPIYTYQDPDFTLPVSLEYNFDGYRPGQHSGTVGLGWNLSYGGVITREVRGLPDDDSVFGPADRQMKGFYYTVADPSEYISDTLGTTLRSSIYCNTICTPTPTLEMAHNINPFAHVPVYIETRPEGGVPKPYDINSYDLTPDIYHFSIPGHSGDFMFMPDGSIRVFNSDLPYGEVKVEFSPYSGGIRQSGAPYWCSFCITTGDGTKYVFGGRIDNTDYSSSASSKAPLGIPSVSATAFHLDRVIAPNGRELEFRYQGAKQLSVSGSVSYTPDYSGDTYSAPSDTVYSKSYSFFCVPDEIRVDGDVLISFSYATKTHDECGAAYFDATHPGVVPSSIYGITTSSAKRLSSVVVYNNDGDLVDRAYLTQSYASSGTPKMFLDAVSTLRGGRHTFEYDRNRTFPKNDRPETDHWGFWNGRYLSDLRTIVTFSGSRYNQMTGTQKEPDVAYARTGAMTQITYPSGGTTEIEYEAHAAESGLDEEGQIYSPAGSATFPVGGVRVCRTINRTDASAPGDTTAFIYSNGFLYHMPRYLFSFEMYYNNAVLGSGGVAFSTIVTSYNADCDYSVSRDENIGYASVTTTYPDGSRTITEFSNYGSGTQDLFFDEDNHFPYTYRPKRGVLSNIDYIGDQITPGTAPYIALPYVDRRNMRGRVLCETTKDASGATVRETQSEYAADAVYLERMWWNDLEQYDFSPWTCDSPMLKRQTVTDYADDGTSLTTVRLMRYNSYGQVSSEKQTSPQCPADTVNTYYVYYHEPWDAVPHFGLPGALRAAVRTRTAEGIEYLVMGMQSEYSTPLVHIQPSSNTVYRFVWPHPVNGEAHARAAYHLGVPEQTAFTRDSLFRITRADLPGGAWVEYDWDGNNIVQVRENANGNATSYQWKDLVGVTEITAPSGQTEGADYDSRNRLWRRMDTAGRVTESYQYKLKNE